MTEIFIIASTIALYAATIVVVTRLSVRSGLARSLRAYRLIFPRDLAPEAVTAFLRSLAGLLPARRWRAVYLPYVVLETVATEGMISHRLLLPTRVARHVLGELRSAIPGINIEEDEPGPRGRARIGSALTATSHERPLRSDRPAEVASAILAAMSASAGEAIVMQWILAPASPTPAIQTARRTMRPDTLLDFIRGRAVEIPERDRREKRSEPLLLAAARVGTTARTTARARQLLARVVGCFHVANAPGVHLKRRLMPRRLVARQIANASVPVFTFPLALNVKELAGLVGIPIGSPHVPGLTLGRSRQLPAHPSLPTTGKVIAISNFGESERPIAIPGAGGLQHTHVMGPTGTGKSTLLANLILSDIEADHGCAVFDPKGDLVEAVLDRMPQHRTDDVIVVDPLSSRPIGMNLIEAVKRDPELVAEHIVGTMHSLFEKSWGPRTDDVLRSTLLSLVRLPDAAITDAPLVLTDAAFRRRVVATVDDPVLAGFWSWYEGLSEGERAQVIGPVQNKLRSVLLRRRIRNIVGQSESSFSMESVLDEGKVLLFSLSKGVLGDEAAALLGSLAFARMWQAALARASQPETSRRPFFIYIDEVQDFLRLEVNVGDLLAQARGYGIGLVLAHQHLHQLGPKLKEGVLANCRSKIMFQCSASDARTMAREFAPYLEPTDLQGLGAYEIAASISLGSEVVPPVTGRTLPLRETLGRSAEMRSLSAERLGRDLGEVEAALNARYETRTSGAVGGRRLP